MLIDKETLEVIRLRDEEDKTWEDIAEELDFPGEWTARRKYKAGMLANALGDIEEELEELPAQEVFDDLLIEDFLPPSEGLIERFTPLVRVGNAIISADYHVPLHDPDLINKMIEVARKHEIKQLIIAGDFWNMDTFSTFLPEQPEAAWPIEHREGIRVMRTLLNTFDEVDFTWGNHDFRLVRKLGYKKSYKECMDWTFQVLTDEEKAKIRISDLDYMNYYPTGVEGRKFRVCHPSNYSSVPLAVPKKLAPKYNCSIMSAHSHHFSLGVAPNGYDLMIELGGFFDKKRTEYIQRTNDNHEWTQGFVMLKEGIPTLFGPAFGNL